MTTSKITLSQLLAPMNIDSLIQWTLSIDPNSSFNEWLSDDPSVTADELRDAITQAYDDEDTHAWINKA
jgi:hypothetical protein